ncbi:MAG: flagellar biosynthetic protein FliR [Deltaproteobacteria bacterium]
MDVASALIHQAGGYMLVVSRLAGFVATSPFPGSSVPTNQRVGLVVALAALIAPSAVLPSSHFALDAQLLLMALTEAGCGLAIGMAFRLVFAAAEVLGPTLAQAVGLSVPSTLNPQIESMDTPLGHLVALLAMLLALQLGVHRIGISYVLASFHAIPLGSPMAFSNIAPGLVDMFGEALSRGVLLALPVLATGLVVQSVLAMVSRAAPTLQVFNIGFGILVASTLAVLLSSLRDISRGLMEHYLTLGPKLERLLDALGSP